MGQAFLYGSGSGAGSGGTLVITAPAGVTCTVSKDGKTKTKTVDQYGYATFKGLDTGTWTVTISDGSETATATVEIVADYAKTMTFFAATIAVTFPEGSTCTCSDGNTTLTAPTTSGSYTFTVPNAGDWTVSCTDGDKTDSATVTITADGENQQVELSYAVFLFSATKPYSGSFTGAAWLRDTTSSDMTAKTPTVSVNETSLTATLASGTDVIGSVYNDTPIDCAEMNTLRITLKTNTDSSSTAIRYGISNSLQNKYTFIASGTAYATTEKEYTIDLTEVNQKGYFMLFLYNKNTTLTVTITDIRVE